MTLNVIIVSVIGTAKWLFFLPQIYFYAKTFNRRVFIWLCLLMFLPSKLSLEHVTSKVSGLRVQNKKTKPNPNYLVLFFIIKCVSLSWFLRLYHFCGLLTAYFLYEVVMSVRLYDRPFLRSVIIIIIIIIITINIFRIYIIHYVAQQIWQWHLNGCSLS